MSRDLFSNPFYSRAVFGEVRNAVQRMDSADLVDSEAVIARLVEERVLTELTINWDDLTVLPQHREREVHSRDVFGDDIRTVIPVYTFEVPYTGSTTLFSIQPSTSRLRHLEANLTPGKLSFEIEGSDKARLEQITEAIKFNVANQKNEVASYNGNLAEEVRRSVERRVEEIGNHDEGLNAFGVPVKGRGE